MSRIGRLPIAIPAGVTVSVDDANVVLVKGPLGQLSQAVAKGINVSTENNNVVVTRDNDSKDLKAKHGLYRSLIFNMVSGVVKAYEISLTLNGVGYKADKTADGVSLKVGYSHPIVMPAPEGISIEIVNPTTVKIVGIDKERVGEFAANIIKLRKYDPFHGYGIYKTNVQMPRKERKAKK